MGVGAAGLEGKVALVTGAASGIGRSAARRFADAGTRVMCADIDGPGAKRVVEQISATGGVAAPLDLDVTDETAVQKALEQTQDALGGFDILFNNAGIAADSFDRTMDVNVNGVFYGLRYGASLLAERGGGAIINTASIAGVVGLVFPTPVGTATAFDPNGVGYMASKHAVVGMTRQFAIQYARRGVRCGARGTVPCR